MLSNFLNQSTSGYENWQRIGSNFQYKFYRNCVFNLYMIYLLSVMGKQWHNKMIKLENVWDNFFLYIPKYPKRLIIMLSLLFYTNHLLTHDLCKNALLICTKSENRNFDFFSTYPIY